MKYQLPTRDELRTQLITALVRTRVHVPDFESELIECLAIIEEVAEIMPAMPTRLRLVKSDPTT